MKPLAHPNLGDPVRFRRPHVEKSWRYGRLVSLAGDTVEISTDHGRYSVERRHVEKQTTGPRGGVRWEEL